jgi:hypothetical protein
MNKTCISRQIRFTLILFVLAIMDMSAKAQYFYKDIIVTGQINSNYRLLKDNKVTHVTLAPAALDPGQNAVILQQTVYPSQNLVVTYTKVPDATESWLKSYYNKAGYLVRTVDSSADVVTSSSYQYNTSNQLIDISSNSVPVNDPAEKEEHKWIYNSVGQPVQMIKVKNNNDTTLVSFTADEQGSVGEEKSVHKNNSLGSVYYYYDAQHRLTDVARFNARANRILPEYCGAGRKCRLPDLEICLQPARPERKRRLLQQTKATGGKY